ncbi:MAG: polyprenyl diphosphate synthase [Bacteroidetes bacterium]|nr:polyprenyl diphosphate synthase [Bacteroidota bacterium]MDA0903441.1 polyprenyl diphosphate synthase [Bacteroidota bacterium]MDA1241527.1 polyprenyl diphosphate synthase [Bacteroidota bacterium]
MTTPRISLKERERLLRAAGIDPHRIPEHVAIIMDGNGRWAKRRGEARVFGHAHGVESVRNVVEAALECGVRVVTLYAFSTENWNRPKEEVDALMDLLVKTLVDEAVELGSKGVRLRAIGDLTSLPQACQEELERAKKGPEGEVLLDVVLALSYSAKWEMVEAIRQIMREGLSPEQVLPSTIDKHLQTADLPDPELMIRTSGEHRISNFMLWQLAYAEFHFTSVLWPDFRKKHFMDAIRDFQHRERRFGALPNPNHGR